MDGGPGGGGIIHCGVRPHLPGDRVLAGIGEAAADAVVLERRLQEGLSQALPFFAPILVAAVALVEAYCSRTEGSAVVEREFHAVDTHHFALTDGLVIDHPEAVAVLEAEKVHGPGIDVCEIHDKQRRDAGGQHVIP